MVGLWPRNARQRLAAGALALLAAVVAATTVATAVSVSASGAHARAGTLVLKPCSGNAMGLFLCAKENLDALKKACPPEEVKQLQADVKAVKTSLPTDSQDPKVHKEFKEIEHKTHKVVRACDVATIREIEFDLVDAGEQLDHFRETLREKLLKAHKGTREKQEGVSAAYRADREFIQQRIDRINQRIADVVAEKRDTSVQDLQAHVGKIQNKLSKLP